MSELLCGSLFSGVGGMDLGFTWAGFRHAFFAEIDPFGRAVLAERFPGVPIYSDVRDVPECGSGIPCERGEWPRLDVLTFGSPCQDLSVAGKRRGLDGDRSGLFWEAMRIAGDGPLRPRALLMENVEGLLSSNGGRDFALVLDAMAERGYRWSYRVLDSQHFAVPQRRRRVFVCAVADDDPRAERIAEVFALAEGGGGDSPTSDPSWPRASSRSGAGAPSGRVIGALTVTAKNAGDGGWHDNEDHLVPRERERERETSVVGVITQQTPSRPDDKSAQAGHLIVQEVVSSLSGGGERGHRVDAESAAGGHLIPVQAFRKSARVSGPDTPETWVDDGLANTLNSFDVGDVRTTHAVVQATAVGGDIAHALTHEGHDASEDGTGRGTPVVATGFNATGGSLGVQPGPISPTLRVGSGIGIPSPPGVHVGPAVRRLTPLECERLQGWPDDWTDIPWNGKDHAPDSRRYAACGNGVTATVAYWIAARLAEVLK
jgi:DNA (cytosine-5)-methyltransferase 1